MGESAGRYDLNSSGEVGEFIERLALLPPSSWIAAVSSERPAGGEASAHLQSLIKETGRQIDVWSANDSVDAAAHIAFGRIAGDKRFLANRASAIRCAKSAAIALLLRSDLSPEEFERLYRPFGKLIPVGDLAGSEKPATRSS